MATSPKVVLVAGLSFAALCVLAGFMMESDADREQIDAVNSAHWRTQNMPITRPEEAKMHADFLARTSPEMAAVGLKYEGKAAVLMIRSPRMRWQRIVGIGGGLHETAIPDSTGTFRLRWERGMRSDFGKQEGSRFVPFEGRVRVSIKREKPSSMNVLDYLDFAFRKSGP